MMTICSPATARPGIADEHLVADADVADAVSLAIADVIVQRAGPADPLPLPPCVARPSCSTNAPHERIARLFARYPGCAVAAVTSGEADADLVGLRDGRSIEFALQPGSGAAVARSAGGAAHGVRWAGTSSTVAVCASLVHVWMASGRRIDELDSATVVATASLGSAAFLVQVSD
jgi:hypothetical protein